MKVDIPQSVLDKHTAEKNKKITQLENKIQTRDKKISSLKKEVDSLSSDIRVADKDRFKKLCWLAQELADELDRQGFVDIPSLPNYWEQSNDL